MFKKEHRGKDVLFTIIIVSLVFMMQNNVFYTPFVYLMGVYMILRILFLLKKILSKKIAIKISNDFLIFNNSLLVNNMEIPITAIKTINISDKYAEILNIKKYFKNSVLYRINKFFNGNRIMLNNLSLEDITTIYDHINPMK